MKWIVILTTLISSLLVAETQEPRTVDDLDIDRYQGLWHQIAFIPNWFQRKCVGSVTAEYTLTTDRRLKVINQCMTDDGRFTSKEGRARVHPKFEQNAKLQVTFVKIFRWVWAFGGPYWVLDIDNDYQHVIVGHPERKYLWILARSPELSDRKLAQLRRKIEEFGYDPCSVQLSQAGYSYGTSLCSLNGTKRDL